LRQVLFTRGGLRFFVLKHVVCNILKEGWLGRRIAVKKLFFTGLLLKISLLGCTTAIASDFIQQERITKSPQWNGEAFQNPERVPAVEWWPSLKMFWRYCFNKPEGYIPEPALPTEPFNPSQWGVRSGLQLSWLGHTTFLIQIDDKIILTDPVFSQRAGSFSWLSPKRYSNTIASTDILPFVDIVLITHNHPDHLDEMSIRSITPKVRHFITPLAVGDLLIEWGVPREKITELDWWQTKSIDNLNLTAAPANLNVSSDIKLGKHYSRVRSI
jgi:hypothetical protein